MTLRAVALLSILSAVAASAQTARPAFEVATVRPRDPKNPLPSAIRVTGQQISITGMPLRVLMEQAYGIKTDRMEGPGWVAGVRALPLDIEAKMPVGSRLSQLPLMLQVLLEDRLKLVVHRGTKIADFYALTVGKDGIKFSKTDTPDDFTTLDWGNQGTTAGVFQANGAKTTDGPNGLESVEASTMVGVVALLTPHFGGLPVIDKTGLQGTYDMKFQYRIPDVAAARAEGRPTSEFLAELHDQAKAGTIAGVEKLGLKVEKQHGEIEVLIIDHVEAVPTEN